MFCPRCGTLGSGDAVHCARCGAQLARPRPDAPEPPPVRAPTNRGEGAQRAAGVDARPLPKAPPRPPRAAPPDVPPVPAAPTRPGAGPGAPPQAPFRPPGVQPAPPPARPPGVQPAPPPAWSGSPGGAAPAPPPGWAPAPAGSPQAPPAPSAWPPPPAQWQPTGSGRWAPPRPTQPGTQSPAAEAGPVGGPRAPAPPPHWSRPPAWNDRRPATGWARPTGTWWDRLFAGSGTAEGRTYFWQSLVCLFLFLPTGAAAVAYSLLVSRRQQIGDRDGSLRASQMARLWCLVTVAVFGVAVAVTAATGIHG